MIWIEDWFFVSVFKIVVVMIVVLCLMYSYKTEKSSQKQFIKNHYESATSGL